MGKGERVIQVIWPVVLSFKIQTAKCHAQSIGDLVATVEMKHLS